MTALFQLVDLRNRIGLLVKALKLSKEVQRVQYLADKAQASRIENLHQLIATEFSSAANE